MKRKSRKIIEKETYTENHYSKHIKENKDKNSNSNNENYEDNNIGKEIFLYFIIYFNNIIKN
jgi:hypothetical protein